MNENTVMVAVVALCIVSVVGMTLRLLPRFILEMGRIVFSVKDSKNSKDATSKKPSTTEPGDEPPEDGEEIPDP